MTDDSKNTVLKALLRGFRPLARLLLRTGITWKEAALVCKAAYVEVASEDFGLHGRPTNKSRVAILTGLSRREVSRLIDSMESGVPADVSRINAASRVLSGWFLDRDFLDDKDRPKPLSFEGAGMTFTTLAHRYASDIAPITMLRELKRVSALEEVSGELRVLKRYYMPAPMDPDAVLRSGSVYEDLGSTLNYNLGRSAEMDSRFEGRAANGRIRASDESLFRQFLEREGQAFLERVDAWLSEHEIASDSTRRGKALRLGAGVYQIEDRNFRSDE